MKVVAGEGGTGEDTGVAVRAGKCRSIWKASSRQVGKYTVSLLGAASAD